MKAGELIRIRKIARLTQWQMAAVLRISKNHLSKLERGVHDIEPRIAERAALVTEQFKVDAARLAIGDAANALETPDHRFFFPQTVATLAFLALKSDIDPNERQAMRQMIVDSAARAAVCRISEMVEAALDAGLKDPRRTYQTLEAVELIVQSAKFLRFGGTEEEAARLREAWLLAARESRGRNGTKVRKGGRR